MTDATQVRLAGRLNDLVFPRLCPNCGLAADQTIGIAKAFLRIGGSDRLRHFEIARVDVPFCGSCAARHHAEQGSATLGRSLGSLLRTELAWPAIGLAGLAIFLTAEMAGKILRNPATSWPLAAMLLVLFALAGLTLKAAWAKGERHRIPAPTSILAAFDFGDDESNDFGTYARTYSIRNPHFAQAFADLNSEASEQLLGPREKARTNRNFAIGLLLLAGVVAWQLLKGG